MTALFAGLDDHLPALHELYRDLHANPELSFQEVRTAGIVASRLREQGWEVTEKVGGTGVVGVLTSGEGPVVLLRADMDALPVLEETGLPYASTRIAVDAEDNEVPVMHACGHDMHVTCLLGATALLARNRDAWRGTVVAVFQPAEEVGGAPAMIEDGFAERFPRPDVCLGQHVSPVPVGTVGTRSGPVMAAADTLRVRLFGRGGHGSRPEATVDPVVLAAAIVTRLQTVVAREVAAGQQAVVTVGAIHAGTKANIIPSTADLHISVRTETAAVREQVLAAVRRIIRGEAIAAGADRDPEVTVTESFPVTVNDAAETGTVLRAFTETFGEELVFRLPQAVTGSEDFGVFGAELGAPSVYWFFGGTDHAAFGDIDREALLDNGIPPHIPSNHSPLFTPVPDPAVGLGVRYLLTAAAPWLTVQQGHSDVSEGS
ncbi:hippurate hydrolase [Saccharopolyspora antimicrobica]|uniref:Hippurate hydrolase n=1 Tax=Saccharopolyspora antimicrobica TaxID=455193 RepID=A0A1I5C8S2_9PSEU|nr:amidohydrolase [Saccharopolyspora antimicrobica]RKT88941.1 hippurate hydrolase [Saccharopolyspora antimicrobica]SFN83051.1 hippurate hydrolase [Saccharopolyspora antimicrobica]